MTAKFARLEFELITKPSKLDFFGVHQSLDASIVYFVEKTITKTRSLENTKVMKHVPRQAMGNAFAAPVQGLFRDFVIKDFFRCVRVGRFTNERYG
jgi:hypothetical protein